MQQQFEALKEVLDEEVRIYAKVEAAMLRKKQLIIEGKTADLEKLDQELITLGQTTMSLEQKRMSLMETLGHKDKTLKEFSVDLPPALSKDFLKRRNVLSKILANIQSLNQQNRELLDMSLLWISKTVDAIASVIAPEAACYDAKGSKKTVGSKKKTQAVQSTKNWQA